MTFDITDFILKDGVKHWLWVFGSVCGALFLASLLLSYVVSGVKGFSSVFKTISGGITDLYAFSIKRVLAIASLTIKEVVRKKTLMVFVVFAVLFMFGGWFLTGSTGSRDDLEVKNFISFALTTTSWLILPVSLLMSCWGVPEDIKARSIHTIVTKPARRLEIVIGRIVGYVIVGTGVLIIMGIAGNIWVHRQVQASEKAQKALFCRVPLYGDMSFFDSEGKQTEGIHVGDVWDYRRYIKGATQSTALWEFEKVTPDILIKDTLKIEARFEAFRTHKGHMKEGLLCQVFLENPVNRKRVKLPVFHINEFTQNIIRINRKLKHYDEIEKKYVELDLIDDMVFDNDIDNKKNILRVGVRCIDPGQYIGMAQADMFIRYPDRSFDVGYSKAIVGIWLMMVLIVSMGVSASCFLKGPVATLLTFSFLLVGQGGFRQFLNEFVDKQVLGGGPVESIIRIVTHYNQVKELEEGATKMVAETIDKAFFYFLRVAHQIIPDFSSFKMTPFVVNGFDVSWGSALAPSIAITFAYVIPCVLIGYFSLKSRELESK
jgi:hypothetical protein